MKNKFSFIFILTNGKTTFIINSVIRNGEVAQLARAFGSYPKGHVFESHLRYQIANTVNQIYKNRVY